MFFLPKLDRRQLKPSVIFPVLSVIFIKRFIHAPTILGSPLLSCIMARQLHGKKKKANRSECSGNLQIREALWGTIHSIDTSIGEGINADWRFHTFPSEIQDAVPCRKGADKITVDNYDRCVIRRTINDLLFDKKTLSTVQCGLVVGY